MRSAALGCLLAVLLTPLVGAEDKVPASLDFKMKSLEGKDVSLSKYQGKVILVVNVASR
jgi:glutathione peroxidase